MEDNASKISELCVNFEKTIEPALPAASTHQLTSTTATNELQDSISPNSTPVEVPQTNSLESVASASIPLATQENIQARPIQTNQSRCFKCKAKIPLAKQTINKCQYVYCDNHKIPDKHDCDFDFAKMGKDILAKNNPKLNEVHKGGRSFNRID
ncbi:14436_t:CDS:2 [Dentiscutata erythropus]|uniref:14436_t:CDS:1 n=1 Tax=Dentiscutata erythropus TaxID=1348616 RepID=A0A9N9FIQ8_9GLOM|nr:14436_t:CDS:2 [Dentiscutata erythropus]